MNIVTTEITPKSGPQNELRPVSIWYMASIVAFSLGAQSVVFCSNQVLQNTLRDHFTKNETLIGFVMAFNALNMLWVTPYVAWKSDRIWTRFGRRRPIVMIAAPVLALAVILTPHAPSLWVILLLVFTFQVAEDAEIAVVAPSVSDTVPDKQRQIAGAMMQFIPAIAIFIMGRYVMRLTDRAEHWPYTIAGLLVIVTAIIYLLAMREHYVPPRTNERFRLFNYGREIFRLREYRLIYVVFLCQPLWVIVATQWFASLATRELRMTQAEYGSAWAYSGLVTLLAAIPLGYLCNMLGRRRMFALMGSMLVLVPLTYGIFWMRSGTGIAVFAGMQSFCFNLFRMNFIPYVMLYTTPRNVATIFGFTSVMNGLVRFTMIPLAGFLIGLTGNYRIPLWGGYIGVIACIAAILAMRPPEKVRDEIAQIDAEAASALQHNS